MTFKIKIEKDAAKILSKINASDRSRIVKAVDKLKHDIHLGSPLSGQWKGLRRLRIGNYRIIYGIKAKELLILVVRIDHRREIYR